MKTYLTNPTTENEYAFLETLDVISYLAVPVIAIKDTLRQFLDESPLTVPLTFCVDKIILKTPGAYDLLKANFSEFKYDDKEITFTVDKLRRGQLAKLTIPVCLTIMDFKNTECLEFSDVVPCGRISDDTYCRTPNPIKRWYEIEQNILNLAGTTHDSEEKTAVSDTSSTPIAPTINTNNKVKNTRHLK